MGFNGFRSGKIIEIRGPESKGKSTIALECVFAFGEHWLARQKKFRIKWIETESAFDATRTIWMRPEIGPMIEVDEAETVEEAHQIMKTFLEECAEKGEYGIIVWDTLAAASTDAQKSSGDQYGGGQSEQARYLRWMFKDLVPLLGKAGAPLILPNQTYLGRAKMAHLPPPTVSYGGGAIRYYSSVRIDIQDSTKPMKHIAENGAEMDIGIITQNRILKNKITGVKLPFTLWINNEDGLDKLETTLGFLAMNEVVKKSGSWKKAPGPDGKEISWQSSKDLGSKIELNPDIKLWLDYLIYNWYTKSSPLVKLRIIERVWELEKKFFGEKRTELSEREIKTANALEQHLQREMEREEKKALEPDKEKKPRGKKAAKKGEGVIELG
jgi:recombination protein RecA